MVVIARLAMRRLEAALEQFPAVALLGPRQVGKTTLASLVSEQRGDKAVYLDLELPSARARLAEPELYLGAQEGKLVILDEIHRLPGIFQVLRGIIDRRRRRGIRSGQFLVLGSASMDLMRQSAETLAGRIAYVELASLTGTEVLGPDAGVLDRLWLRGGFPESFLAADDNASAAWRQAFIQTYLDRDIPMLGPRIPAETLHRFWRMLAHAQGQLFHAAPMAAGLGVSGQTVARYLDVLADLLLVRRLEPWAGNAKKRLVRSPKLYVRDSGLVHALLGVGSMEDLLGHPVAGPSWEGLVVENILTLVGPGGEACFYRSSNGAEIDLVLRVGSRRRHAIEVKRSLDPRPAKGFYVAADDLGIGRRWVVYPGRERFALDEQTTALPFRAINEATFE